MNFNFADHSGTLTLSDHLKIKAISFGAETASSGELVFNTGMMGYLETLTDPSYSGQILVMTYPLVGNYGVPKPDAERMNWLLKVTKFK